MDEVKVCVVTRNACVLFRASLISRHCDCLLGHIKAPAFKFISLFISLLLLTSLLPQFVSCSKMCVN